MNTSTTKPDVNKIMEKIKKNIAQNNLNEELPSFLDLPISLREEENTGMELSIVQSKLHMILNRSIEYDKPLWSRGGPLGKIATIFKKCIRRISRFYVLPIAEDLNDTCTFLAQALASMQKVLDQNDALWHERLSALDIAVYREMKKNTFASSSLIPTLQKENADIRTELDALKEQYIALEQELNSIKSSLSKRE